MSFTDGKPRIATEVECQTRWNGHAPGKGFGCYLCGHKFVVGDYWRWQYAINRGFINFMVCKGCDGGDVVDRFAALVESLQRHDWWRRR